MEQDKERMELELRASSDALVLAAEQLLASEQLKRRIDVDTEEFRDLAELIEEQGRDVAAIAANERRLADSLAGSAEAGAIGTVEEITAAASLADILAKWRSAEREAASAVPGTMTAHRAAVDARALREEYRRAYERLTSPNQEASG
jgi:hypothetical protein